MAIDSFLPSPVSDSSAEEMETYQESLWEEAAKNETEEHVFYKTKKIDYRGETKRIILQDKNGPCPLIAICNVLILRGQINLHPDSSEESQENLLNHVAEILVDETEDEYIDLELLKRLTKGIDVDLKFKSIKDFVVTPELALFDLLKIPLYHGWIVDPQDLEIATAIGDRSYDALTIELTALDTQTVVKARSGQISGECSVGFDASITAIPGAPSQLQGLSKREVLLQGSFDTHRDSNEGEGEVVSGSSDVNLISEDDTLVTSLDAAAGCTVTIGSNVCQLRFDHQFPSAESEYRMGCNAGNKINIGKEASSTTITKSSEAHDHDQLSSMELRDETSGDV